MNALEQLESALASLRKDVPTVFSHLTEKGNIPAAAVIGVGK